MDFLGVLPVDPYLVFLLADLRSGSFARFVGRFVAVFGG